MTLLLAGALLLLSPAAARAQSLDAELAPAVDALFDLQLDTAAALARRAAADHPGHPAPAFYEAMVEYQKWAFDPEGPAAPPKALEDALARTESLAVDWESTSTVEGLYYYGAARGFAGRVLADRGHWFKAAAPGLRAIRALRRAQAMDPALVDADLGIGMYDYFRSQMPAAAKPFAFLFTFDTGSRERGLKELTTVAYGGGLAKAEAQNVLSAIYVSEDEREFGQAAALLSALSARYPHNPAFRMRLGYAELRLGHWDQAIAADEPDGPWLEALDPRVREQARQDALYRAAEAALFAGRYAQAAGWLDALAKLSPARPLDDWTTLRRANLCDAQGRREEALALYRKSASGPVRAVAEGFLQAPFPDGPKDVKPWSGLELPR